MFANALRQSKLAASACRSFSTALPAARTMARSRLSSQAPMTRLQSTPASRASYATTTKGQPRTRKPENPPSKVLFLLGMDASTSIEDVKAIVGPFNPSDVKLMTPTALQVAFINFPDPKLTAKALEEVKTREGVKDAHQIYSKQYEADCTVMIVGDIDIRQMYKSLAAYKPERYMLRPKRSPFGVVVFEDVEAATQAREALSGKEGFRPVFGVPQEDKNEA